MKNILKKISINSVIFMVMFFPVFLNAQSTSPVPTTPQNPPIVINIPNPTSAGSDLMAVLNTLLRRVVMPIAAIAVVMYIIWAGFSYLTAQGNPKKIEEANARLLWALIGAGILLGAAGISAVVENTVRGLITS